MSLTSYRAAPSRVTECPLRGPIPETAPENNFAAHSGRDETLGVPLQPAEPRPAPKGGAKKCEGGLLPMTLSGGQDNGDQLGRPGSDLLSRVLRHSTIGAGELNYRVRNGIGWGIPARTTRSAKLTAITTTIVYDFVRIVRDIYPISCCNSGRHARRHTWV